jgi:hypothetical protein
MNDTQYNVVSRKSKHKSCGIEGKITLYLVLFGLWLSVLLLKKFAEFDALCFAWKSMAFLSNGVSPTP